MSRTSARRRRAAPWPVAAVALLLALAGAGGYAALNGGGAPAGPTAAGASTPALPSPPGARTAAGVLDASGARAALAQLPVKGRAPATGYDRVARFGEAWLDVDRNGCDTRDDILARDLAAATRRADCAVLTGTLSDPYTGRSIAFTRGVQTSALVQIDHVVALLDAWQTGAQGLSQEGARPARERPARAAGGGRGDEPGERRGRRRDLAAAEPRIPLRVRGPPGRGEGEVRTVGDGRGGRSAQGDPGGVLSAASALCRAATGRYDQRMQQPERMIPGQSGVTAVRP
ncbi:hypothetical protein ABH923_002304 [Leifsonia sp. EB41]